jgi:hypothetical protein
MFELAQDTTVNARTVSCLRAENTSWMVLEIEVEEGRPLIGAFTEEVMKKSTIIVAIALMAVSCFCGCGVEGYGEEPERRLIDDDGSADADADADTDCPVCGDGTCDSTESCESCIDDCGECPAPGPVCGDDECNGDETCASCVDDCGECGPVCGDAVCEGNEGCASCPIDCGDCPVESFCGDQSCDGDETCESCVDDCGECPAPGPVCGDGECNGDETCEFCPCDCGACPEPEPECGDGVCEYDRGEDHLVCSEDCCTPGPFRVLAVDEYVFNSYYISGAGCAEVRGEVPGMTWESGPDVADTDADGWLEWSAIPTAGVYRFSYAGHRDCEEADPSWREGWAQYAHPSQLAAMCESDLAYIYCQDDGCSIRVEFTADGSALPAGNMTP